MPVSKVKLIMRIIMAVIALPVVVYCLVYQPWDLHWGARGEEIRRAMPGDDIITDPSFNATRAVTIQAAPEDIWPWIVQIGYLRAGFYSHDRLDNDGVPSAGEIIPEYQSIAVGDRIPLTARGFLRVESMQVDSFLCLVCPDQGEPWFTWVWGLYPLDGQRTRLVVRLRWHQEHWLHTTMTRLFEIVMMKRHMLGIKKRAESFHGADLSPANVQPGSR